MRVMLPYGNKQISLDIPDENLLAVSEVNSFPPLRNVEDAVERAIYDPIGTQRLLKMAKPGDSAAIVVDDITRPVPNAQILNPVLKELNRAGIQDENIIIIIACGMHRPNTVEEQRAMLGKVVNRIRIINHDPRDEQGLLHIGTTKRGVPVRINRAFAKSKVKILTGMIAPHQCAGFSGGRKSILPGISSYDTIRIHHSSPITERGIVVGKIHQNMFHEEALEAAKMVGIDFIVNVVMNSRDEAVKVVAGDLDRAWLNGVDFCGKLLEANVPEYADIAVVSPGGYPRDINFWQSQKALTTGELITKKGGTIILVAQCKDGMGEEELQWFKWLSDASTPKDVIERFEKEGYVDGNDKAYVFARALQDFRVMVVNENLNGALLQDMFLEKYGDVQTAMNVALSSIGKRAQIAVFPYAVECLPKISKGFKE